MPSLGHLAVGLAATRLIPKNAGKPLVLLLLVLAVLPDLDVLGFGFGVPYASPFGHRGASHSLFVALLVGVLVFGVARFAGRRESCLRIALLATLVVALHGVADAFTDGGEGVALLWPWSEQRFFSPWRPLPVAPLGRAFLGARGFEVIVGELGFFLPFLAFGLLPRRRRAEPRPSLRSR